MPEVPLPYDGIDYHFEFLARAVFNCGRYGDPLGIANHDEYTITGTTEGDFSFRRPLSIVIHKMVFDYPDNESLGILEERIWQAKSQEEFVSIIEDAIEIYRGL